MTNRQFTEIAGSIFWSIMGIAFVVSITGLAFKLNEYVGWVTVVLWCMKVFNTFFSKTLPAGEREHAMRVFAFLPVPIERHWAWLCFVKRVDYYRMDGCGGSPASYYEEL